MQMGIGIEWMTKQGTLVCLDYFSAAEQSTMIQSSRFVTTMESAKIGGQNKVD